MKRRDFLEITGIFSAGVVTGLTISLSTDSTGKWVSAGMVAVGDLVIFMDETVGFISEIKNKQALVVPMSLKEPITEEHVTMDFIVFANATRG